MYMYSMNFPVMRKKDIINAIKNEQRKMNPTNLISILDAPASREFSISSFTTELTEVITCELAISRIVDEGKRFIAF